MRHKTRVKFIFGGHYSVSSDNFCEFHLRHELIRNNKPLPLTDVTITETEKVKGVVECFVTPYKFTVRKAEAYSWQELTPKIKSVMVRYLSAIHD
jgi:hypothetical protein